MLLYEPRRAYAAAIAAAQQLLHHDPLHEATYRRLMRLHALNGDRAAALRVYHTCTSILEQELGVEPGAATHELYERLVHATGDQIEQPPREPGLNLVGRADEWQTLQAAWRPPARRRPLRRGERGGWWVAGFPGLAIC